MALVTLLTDSGDSDYYVAAIKAKILSINPGMQIVDISHKINACDIAHGAFVLKSVFRDFPKGSVHLVGVNTAGNPDDGYIALQLEDHFFVGADNGLFGLISDKNHQSIVMLNTIKPVESTFPEKDILAPAAAQLASGLSLDKVGTPVEAFRKMTDRQVKATRKQLSGHVVRVDHYGNVITNIPKDTFDTLSAGKNFTVLFGGEKFRKIHTNFNQADQGDCFLIFNSIGFLQIGIYKGNASELLGLAYDSPVIITFDD